MLTRVRRPLAALVLAPALALILAACSDNGSEPAATESTATPSESDESGGADVDSLAVDGEVGAAPEVAWDGPLDVAESTTSVLVEGSDGEPLTDGETVVAHVWVGNATKQEKSFSTYDQDAPVAFPVDKKQLNPALYLALLDHAVGSRVQVVSPPADAFGPGGNPDVGIASTDDVVFIVDLVQRVRTEPSGTLREPPADAPTVVEEGGTPTGIDFSTAPRTPSDQLQVITLVEGDGPTVASGDDTVMNYLGQVYRSDKIFDQSFDSQPFSTAIGTGSVIKGWDQGLVGLPVGSRVVLVIPPDLGYGSQGSGDIPADSTLTFVVDILAAY